jgi:glycosyltransferase involved in cell wall biosynthesis
MSNALNSTQDLTVAIFLCTYNGDRFLKSQLDSLLIQTHKKFVIYVSDDNSSDKTLEILYAFQQNHPDRLVYIFKGPGMGFSRNFMSLVANHNIQADFYAFCDQDDYWLPSKITTALEKLIEHNQELH